MGKEPYDPTPPSQRPVPIFITFVGCAAAGFVLVVGIMAGAQAAFHVAMR